MSKKLIKKVKKIFINAVCAHSGPEYFLEHIKSARKFHLASQIDKRKSRPARVWFFACFYLHRAFWLTWSDRIAASTTDFFTIWAQKANPRRRWIFSFWNISSSKTKCDQQKLWWTRSQHQNDAEKARDLDDACDIELYNSL